MSTAPGRVLLRLPNWLGDALMARRAAFALRRALPAARILAVGPRPVLDLLAGDGAWDGGAAPGEPEAAAGALARERWDAAVLMPPSFSSAWWALRAGARLRIGYRGDLRDPLLTDALPRRAPGALHASAEYLALASRLGAVDAAVPALAVPAGAAARASALAGADHWVLLGPGAVYGPAKRWGSSRFAEVARALAPRGWRVLVVGARADAAACAEVAARAPGAIDLAGRTSLPELAALCAGARAVVCNDSGLAHLAAAAGAPTVAVFGSTSSAWTAPAGPRARVVQRAPVCAPCFRRTCAIGYRCLEAVTVRAVLREIEAAA